MRHLHWILPLLFACGTPEAPKQSTPVSKVSTPAGGRVDMAIDNEGPKPISIARLSAFWPALSTLKPRQQRAVTGAVNLTPSPCGSCGDLPIAHCIEREMLGSCTAVDKLLKRAIRMVKAGRDGGQIKAALNYPDIWVPGLGEGTPVQLHLYRDAEGPFQVETSANLEALSAQFGDQIALTIREADVVPDPSIGVRSRPTWFINGHRFRGAQTSVTLARFIAFELLDAAP